ncbi:MAG: AtpZ/AtpI family protein [Nitrospirae bacterium]|nr:AtpZ/AtpI family protein [Nitrospirota bacterium]
MAEKKPEKSLFGQLLDASSVGIYLVVSTFVGLAIGYGLDRLFGTSPYLTFIFLILGIITGFRELVKVARKAEGTKNGNNDKKGK